MGWPRLGFELHKDRVKHLVYGDKGNYLVMIKQVEDLDAWYESSNESMRVWIMGLQSMDFDDDDDDGVRW